MQRNAQRMGGLFKKPARAGPADTPPPLPDGPRLGPYIVLEPQWMEGTLPVHRAVKESGEEVSLKILDSADKTQIERFKREIQMLVELDSPYLLKCLDTGEDGSRLYLATEPGFPHTLRDAMDDRTHALARLDALMAAVGYLHDAGIVHRDIKPEHILVQGPHIKLVGFGVARGHVVRRLTMMGSNVGTPAYMAPEAMYGETTPKSDQYTIGAIAYEMFSGVLPYDNEDAKLVNDPPPLDGVPPAVAGTIQRMLARDRTDRFSTMEEARKALHGRLS